MYNQEVFYWRWGEWECIIKGCFVENRAGRNIYYSVGDRADKDVKPRGLLLKIKDV